MSYLIFNNLIYQYHAILFLFIPLDVNRKYNFEVLLIYVINSQKKFV